MTDLWHPVEIGHISLVRTYVNWYWNLWANSITEYLYSTVGYRYCWALYIFRYLYPLFILYLIPGVFHKNRRHSQLPMRGYLTVWWVVMAAFFSFLWSTFNKISSIRHCCQVILVIEVCRLKKNASCRK